MTIIIRGASHDRLDLAPHDPLAALDRAVEG